MINCKKADFYYKNKIFRTTLLEDIKSCPAAPTRQSVSFAIVYIR